MPSVAAAASVGNSADDMTTNIKTLEVNFFVPVSKQLSARFMFQQERGTISDYHYEGLNPANLVMWGAQGAGGAPISPTGVLMDTGPQDYRVTVFGIMALYKF